MSYFVKHKRNTVNNNANPIESQAHANLPVTSSKFAKKQPPQAKISEASKIEEIKRVKQESKKVASDNLQACYRKSGASQGVKDKSKEFNSMKSSNKNNSKGTTESKINESIHNLMTETDNSMQEMLNSSINQFEKYLESNEDLEKQNHSLIQQNQILKESLKHLQSIIKEKLEHALKKQKEELNFMLEDYLKLITKLLKDKEELSNTTAELQDELKQINFKCSLLAKQKEENTLKVEQLSREKDHYIAKTKQQIDEFMNIIEQYEAEAESEVKQADQNKLRIQELEQKIKHLEEENQHLIRQIEVTKNEDKNDQVQSLIELLQKVQSQNIGLRETISQLQKCNEGKGELEHKFQIRINELEQQHEQQFIEYEKAMQETICKKDQCIQRLNMIIQSYRLKQKQQK